MARLTIKYLQDKIKNDYVSKWEHDQVVERITKQLVDWREKAIANEQYKGEAKALSIVCDKLLLNQENPEVIKAYAENERIRKEHLSNRYNDFDGLNRY